MFHILLVEDNPGDVLMIHETIRQYDIPADVTANDAKRCLRYLNNADFPLDIAVLVLNMPRFNALQILERTRREGRPPVIVVTSSTNPGDK